MADTKAADTLLEIDGIETCYGLSQVLFGLSLSVRTGEMVAMMGRNGMGKTTTIRSIMGLTPARAGAIRFAGHEVHNFPSFRIAQLGIGLVPEGRQIFPNLTVRENLAMGAYTRRDSDGVAQDLEAVFGYFPVLRERADQRAGSLSGGEQQMLSISRALMARPRLMLLDEPSLGLSPKLVKDIFEIVVRINRERGVTILLVEQNANMALKTADYGYVLEVGRIVMADSCERLMQKEDIKEFYLGIKEQGARGKRRWKKRKTWR